MYQTTVHYSLKGSLTCHILFRPIIIFPFCLSLLHRSTHTEATTSPSPTPTPEKQTKPYSLSLSAQCRRWPCTPSRTPRSHAASTAQPPPRPDPLDGRCTTSRVPPITISPATRCLSAPVRRRRRSTITTTTITALLSTILVSPPTRDSPWARSSSLDGRCRGASCSAVRRRARLMTMRTKTTARTATAWGRTCASFCCSSWCSRPSRWFCGAPARATVRWSSLRYACRKLCVFFFVLSDRVNVSTDKPS